MITKKQSNCTTEEKNRLKRLVFNLPLKTVTESASIKRSSHKALHNVAEAYKKYRVLIFGTTNMHLPLDLNCFLGLYVVTILQI